MRESEPRGRLPAAKVSRGVGLAPGPSSTRPVCRLTGSPLPAVVRLLIWSSPGWEQMLISSLLGRSIAPGFLGGIVTEGPGGWRPSKCNTIGLVEHGPGAL